MVTAELQASYRQLRRSSGRLLRSAGLRPDISPEFAYTPADEEVMALREFDIRTFVRSDIPEVRKMWLACEEQARLIESLVYDLSIEN